MPLTSRKKRPLNINIPHLRDTRLIIIATEGSKTEKQYFESAIFHSTRVQVKILETKDGLSAPNHVLKHLREFTKKMDFQKGDQIWLMVDKDRWPNRHLSDVCSRALRGNKKTNLAISNPCFELWLYLHIDDWSGKAVSSKEIENILRQKIGSYNKSNIDIKAFSTGVQKALSRARSMNNNSNERWPANPGTHVYRVVDEILKMILN